uniref:Uncharacterized protein n=1 Tax=Periophthalmus magnuspinnatus TaxID=409849 RepID=A0A3B4AZY7_9GOBI
MPIEFVCKIKFAEEDEKQKSQQDGDKESLIEESCSPPAKDLARFANSCSLHGINHIFVSGRLGIRQTLWALAFLTSLALFLYQAAKCAISYLEHPHVTALNEEATPEMVFPAVTICNINRFRFSALTDADIYHLANLTGLPPKNRDGHKPSDLQYPAPDMQDIFNRTGHQLDEMLMSCNFSGQNCSVDDFTVVSQSLDKFTLLLHSTALLGNNRVFLKNEGLKFSFSPLSPNLFCQRTKNPLTLSGQLTACACVLAYILSCSSHSHQGEVVAFQSRYIYILYILTSLFVILRHKYYIQFIKKTKQTISLLYLSSYSSNSSYFFMDAILKTFYHLKDIFCFELLIAMATMVISHLSEAHRHLKWAFWNFFYQFMLTKQADWSH